MLAFFVIGQGPGVPAGRLGRRHLDHQLEVTAYIAFVTNLILLFGVAFEFPLIVLMLNFAGIVSAKRLLSWWRVAIFVFFAFAAVVTPTPDPFGMTAPGALPVRCSTSSRSGWRSSTTGGVGGGKEIYAGLDDDEVSPLEFDADPVVAGQRVDSTAPIGVPEPVAKPAPIERRYDDMT